MDGCSGLVLKVRLRPGVRCSSLADASKGRPAPTDPRRRTTPGSLPREAHPYATPGGEWARMPAPAGSATRPLDLALPAMQPRSHMLSGSEPDSDDSDAVALPLGVGDRAGVQVEGDGRGLPCDQPGAPAQVADADLF